MAKKIQPKKPELKNRYAGISKTKIFSAAKKAIEDNNLFFVEDVVAFIPVSKTWLYEKFPLESNEMNTIKEMLDENKTRTKSAIRSKLFKSDKAAELLALYRLICTPEEHQLLNQSYIDHTTKGEKIQQVIIALPPEDAE
jgi:hypothetical protein